MMNRKTLLLMALGLAPVLIGGCGASYKASTASLGAVRGQEVQPGQSTEVPMTRQQAEEMANANNVSLGASSEEVPGKPDVAAQQGATPPGVGYDNIPGVQYDPALGTLHYGDGVQHHIVHHVHHDAASAAAMESWFGWETSHAVARAPRGWYHTRRMSSPRLPSCPPATASRKSRIWPTACAEREGCRWARHGRRNGGRVSRG